MRILFSYIKSFVEFENIANFFSHSIKLTFKNDTFSNNNFNTFKRKRVDTITNKNIQFKKNLKKNQNRFDKIKRKRIVDY